MPQIELNDIRYHYESDGVGPAVLLLHGFTGSSANWQPLVSSLSERHRVLRPDLLGHGATAIPANASRYAMQQAAADLIALLDALDIAQAHLLGYSMGGRLALYTALHYPERFASLILESASPGLQTQAERTARRESDEGLADKIEAQGIKWFVDFWEGLALWDSQQALSDAVRQQLREGRLRNSPEGLANSLRGMGTGQMPSLWQRLPHLAMPVQLIVGASDAKFLAINQAMQAQMPQAKLTVIENAGHTVHLEQPQRYLEAVQAALD